MTICERTGQWGVAWRHAARGPGLPIPLGEVRSLEECRQAIGSQRAGFLLLEMTADNVVPLLELLAWLQFDFPGIRAAVLAGRGLEDYTLVARQLGAIHVVDSPRSLAPLVELVRRFLASLPRRPLSTREEMWQRLPWKPAAAARDANSTATQNTPTPDQGEK
ncbi:MAG TPA: hypothetical protein VHY20_08995 [Pirellulales bacterium]|nr:hypothetical protein [Pirellulales bacterium]